MRGFQGKLGGLYLDFLEHFGIVGFLRQVEQADSFLDLAGQFLPTIGRDLQLGTSFQDLLGLFDVFPEIVPCHLHIESGNFRLGLDEIKDDLGVRRVCLVTEVTVDGFHHRSWTTFPYVSKSAAANSAASNGRRSSSPSPTPM